MEDRNDPRSYGTEDRPLRCSALDSLVRCHGRALLFHIGLITDESGAAADTGSATHAAVEHWHANGDLQEALDHVKRNLPKFPRADLDEVRLHFTPYTKDPRNQPGRARLIANELKVQFTLDPSENDPTGLPIHVTGTLDQIRRGPDGRAYLWDLKTGSPTGYAMVHKHAFQLAAYCLGAAAAIGETVHPGGIIRSRGWRTRGCDPTTAPGGVFFHATFAVEHIPFMLDRVRESVAAIRSGDLTVGPGDDCEWCPAGGLQGCVPQLLSLCS